VFVGGLGGRGGWGGGGGGGGGVWLWGFYCSVERSNETERRRFLLCTYRYRIVGSCERHERCKVLMSGIPECKALGDGAPTCCSPGTPPQIFRAEINTSRWWPVNPLGRCLHPRGENLIAVVPRFKMPLAGEWGDTRLPLPGGEWRNCLPIRPFNERSPR